MAFGEKLKELRSATGMTQQEIADIAGISRFTIYNYESGKRQPKDISIIKKLAIILKITIDELMDEADYLMLDAEDKGGAKAQRDLRTLISSVSAMFAGGELDDEDKDAALRAITEAYWDAKNENKKHTPKKYQ